jgi:hypothetical protein
LKYAYFFLLIIFVASCSKLETPAVEVISLEELEQLEAVSEKLMIQYQPDRDAYPMGTVQVKETEADASGKMIEVRTTKQFKVSDLMSRLCPLPEDFWKYKYLMTTGRMTQKQLGDLDECYYTQPEWYANDFADIALNKYMNPDLEHWTPEGFGTYPHETILYSKPGEIHNLYSFFGASWIVEQYQGVGLDVVYPTDGRREDGTIASIDPKESASYITAVVSPRDVLVAPAYVLFEAPSDGNNGLDSCAADACWRRKINMTITVADDTPPGMYSIGYDIGALDGYYQAVWADKYKERFAGGRILLKPADQMFKVTVIVG